MRRCLIPVLPLLLLVMPIALSGCRRSSPPSAGHHLEEAESPDQFLASHRGKLLLLLLGRDDCPGTARATAVFDAYAPDKPADVRIVRFDVPLPAEQLKVGPWNHPYPRRIDHDRRLAERLGFFYYPTLYLFDRDGEIRFTGGCDPSRVRSMVNEILAETPGQPKKSYTLPMPAVGQPAPSFSAATLSGEPVTLDSLRGQRGVLLVFARTSCPFTVEALPAVAKIAGDYRKNGVAVTVINSGEQKDHIRPIYDKHAPGVGVVWDESGQISKAYGVDMTPFFFLLDKDGKIAQRRSFTPAAASACLDSFLGLPAQAPRYKPTEAG